MASKFFEHFVYIMQWFIENRPDFAQHLETQSGDGGVRRFLSLVHRTRLRSVLRYMFDEEEFLSPYGIRSLSRYHKDHPYVLNVMGHEHRVDYEPAESVTGLFGAIPIGAVRFGFPSTISWSSHFRNSITFSATNSK